VQFERLAHGLSSRSFLLPPEKYSTTAGLFQNAHDGRAWILEIEGESSTDAALVLGEDQQGAITQKIRAIALSQQVAQINDRLETTGAIASEMKRLAEVDVEIRLGSVCNERSNLSNGFFRLPAVAGPPARSASVKGAGE
jgi:hypothetical protein